MFQFTDANGLSVDTPIFNAMRPVLGSDVAFLPILLKAAEAADNAGYCNVYDEIANNIGAPTRDDLRALGYLTRAFTVTGTRTVQVSFEIELPFEIDEVQASRPADIRDGEVDLSDYFSDNVITGETLRDAINRYAYFDVESTGAYDVDHVRAV